MPTGSHSLILPIFDLPIKSPMTTSTTGVTEAVIIEAAVLIISGILI